MQIRQRKRAHMRNRRAQVSMLGRWTTYQHLRLWPAIEHLLFNKDLASSITAMGQTILKDIQRKMIADIVGPTHPLFSGKNPVGVILDEFGATK